MIKDYHGSAYSPRRTQRAALPQNDKYRHDLTDSEKVKRAFQDLGDNMKILAQNARRAGHNLRDPNDTLDYLPFAQKARQQRRVHSHQMPPTHRSFVAAEQADDARQAEDVRAYRDFRKTQYGKDRYQHTVANALTALCQDGEITQDEANAIQKIEALEGNTGQIGSQYVTALGGGPQAQYRCSVVQAAIGRAASNNGQYNTSETESSEDESSQFQLDPKIRKKLNAELEQLVLNETITKKQMHEIVEYFEGGGGSRAMNFHVFSNILDNDLAKVGQIGSLTNKIFHGQ